MELIRFPELFKLIKISKSQVYRLEKRGRFPKRIRLSQRTIAWQLNEVMEWIEQKKEATNA